MLDKYKLKKDELIILIMIVFIISGTVGFIYETIFYFINSNFKTIYMQGGNFMPWINIYAIGSLIVLFLTRKTTSIIKVFLISAVSTGILEYISGFILLHIFKIRLWDYNKEILNFLNIDGFICLRSILIFAVLSIILVFIIIPIIVKLIKKINTKLLFKIVLTIFIIILFDEIYNSIISKIFNLYNAVDFYKSLGFKYMSF